MTRFSATPGGIDEFNRVRSFTVWENGVGPFAFCATQENADMIADALNGLQPEEEVVEPAPADPDWNLCPRGGDHDYKGPYDELVQASTCSKCGHVHETPF